MDLLQSITIALLTFLLGLFASNYGIRITRRIEVRENQLRSIEKYIDALIDSVTMFHGVRFGFDFDEENFNETVKLVAKSSKIYAMMGKNTWRAIINNKLIKRFEDFDNAVDSWINNSSLIGNHKEMDDVKSVENEIEEWENLVKEKALLVYIEIEKRKLKI